MMVVCLWLLCHLFAGASGRHCLRNVSAETLPRPGSQRVGVDVNMCVSLLLLASVSYCVHCSGQSTAAGASGVFVNGQQLSTGHLAQIEQATGAVVYPGQYWYDAVAGAYGCMGGPTLGRAPAGQQAAPLLASASNGNTGVYVNGRELPVQDLTVLQRAVGAPIPAGRYWIHSDGSYGAEGNPNPVGTLASSGTQGGSGGGCTYSSSGDSSVCSDGSGFIGVSGEDSLGNPWSVSSGNRRRILWGALADKSSRKSLQQVISCPTTTGSVDAQAGTTPSTLGSTSSAPGAGGNVEPLQGSLPAGVSPGSGFTGNGAITGTAPGSAINVQGVGAGGPNGQTPVEGLAQPSSAAPRTPTSSVPNSGITTGSSGGPVSGAAVGPAVGPGGGAAPGLLGGGAGSTNMEAAGVGGGDMSHTVAGLGTALSANNSQLAVPGSPVGNLSAGNATNATFG